VRRDGRGAERGERVWRRDDERRMEYKNASES